MSITSADPQRLQDFVEQAGRLVGQVDSEVAATTEAIAAFVLKKASITGMDLPGMRALGSALNDIEADDRLVAAVVEALVAADGWRGVGIAGVDDAAVAARIGLHGGLQAPAHLCVDASVLLGDPPTSGFADDPVCTATGNFFHREVDLAFPARSSVLDVSRCYNSLAADRVGAFGPGWSSLLDVALVVGPTPLVRLPDGGVIGFGAGGDGTFAAEARPRLKLRRATAGGWELADGPTSGFVFDALGVLVARWVGAARVVLRREGSSVVGLEEQASGRFVELSWEAGRVLSARSSDGRAASYRYADGHLVEVGRPGGSVAYAISRGRVVSVVDADGVLVVRNTYDEAGRVLAQESPFGRVSHYSYGEAGVSVVTGTGPGAVAGNGDGVRNAFVHDRRGNLSAMVGADGATLRLRHDAGGRLVGWRDRRGSEWSVAWNASGTSPVSRRGPEGWEESFAWDDEDRLVEHRWPGGVVSYRYDPGLRTPRRVVEAGGAATVIEVGPSDLPLAVTDADGVRVSLAWDDDGQLVSVTDAIGGVARLGYDACGFLTRLSQPSGAGVTYECDPAGRVVSAVAPGSRWAWSWSAAGRAIAGTDPVDGPWTAGYGDHGAVVEVVDGQGRPTRLRYDAFGNIAGIEGPDGRAYRQGHDGLSQLISVTDPAGATWRCAHDPEGSVVGVVSPTGAASGRQVDALGRTVSQTDAEGRAWRRIWGADGRLAEIVDPAGRVTAYRYDEARRLVEVAVDGVVVGTWSHTAAGRPAGRWVIGGATVSYQWDEAGRLAAVSYGGERMRMASDVDGRVVRAIDGAGRALSVSRDEAGRVVGVVDRKGRERRFELDAAGRLGSAADATGASRFTWEGSLLTRACDALGATTSYGYDQAGRLASVTDPLGGATSLTYDEAGRLGAVTDALGHTSTLLRDAAGGLDGVAHSGGGGTRRWSDATGATVGFSGLGAAGSSLAVRRDGAGRLAGMAPVAALRPGPRLQAFDSLGFDASGRVVASGAGDTYRHDAAGQLIEWVPAGVASVAYEYDPGGRLVAERHAGALTRYTHDGVGRLIRRIGPVGVVTRFTYDAFGRRVGEEGPDGEASVAYEWDEAGRLVGVVRGDSRTGIAYDNLGLPVEVGGVPVDWDLTTGWPVVARIGDVSYRWSDEGLFSSENGGQPSAVPLDWAHSAEAGLDPWGAGGAGGVRLGYRGELAIGGLVFLRARFYDPATRSFLSPDPLPNPPGAPCGANPYHYAWNDPVSFVDPSGMRPLTQQEFEVRKHLDRIGHAGQMVDAVARDPWGTFAMGLVIAAGVGLCFVPGGQVLGVGMLIGAGTSGAFGVATGDFNPRMAALNGLVGSWSGGVGAAVTESLCAAGASAFLARAVVGAAVGGAANIVTQTILGERFSLGSIALSSGSGAAAAVMAPGLARTFSRGSPAELPLPNSSLVPYEAQWASRQLADQNFPGSTGYAMTPEGRTLSVHAAERVVFGGPGRPPSIPLAYVDQILDIGSRLRYDAVRQSIQVQAPDLPGRPYVVVDEGTGTHIVTVLVPKL